MNPWFRVVVASGLGISAGLACAASPDIVFPGVQVTLGGSKGAPQETAIESMPRVRVGPGLASSGANCSMGAKRPAWRAISHP